MTPDEFVIKLADYKNNHYGEEPSSIIMSQTTWYDLIVHHEVRPWVEFFLFGRKLFGIIVEYDNRMERDHVKFI